MCGTLGTSCDYPVLNGILPWDGSFLNPASAKIEHQGVDYTTLRLAAGIVFCILKTPKDNFPYMVEEIKEIFGIPRSGTHRIVINFKTYMLCQVNLSDTGQVIQETPLHRLEKGHLLRKDVLFQKQVQRLLVFGDILALSNTGEPNVRIRRVPEGYLAVTGNEFHTTLDKGTDYDYNVLKKGVFWEWFGENTTMNDVAREMVGFEKENLVELCAALRKKLEGIILRHDKNYIWYSNFIIDRLSRYLL